jgi:hypothetical protein
MSTRPESPICIPPACQSLDGPDHGAPVASLPSSPSAARASDAELQRLFLRGSGMGGAIKG